MEQIGTILESVLRQGLVCNGGNSSKDEHDDPLVTNHDKTDCLVEYLRVMKNLLRWNSQSHSQMSNANLTNPNYVQQLQRPDMLDVYMTFLTNSVGTEDVHVQEMGRFATLCLLYATYGIQQQPALEGDDRLEHLITNLSYLNVFCEVLSNDATTLSVQLANLRLFHTLVVTHQGFVKTVSNSAFLASTSASAAGEEEEDQNTKHFSVANIQDLLLRHLNGSLTDWQDRQQEIALEILRILYVMRAGRTMDQEILKQCLVLSESRLATIMILTDASETKIVDMDVQPILLETLETQVSAVVDNSWIGSEAASALTPILIIIHNLCKANPDYQAATKNLIFPNPVSDMHSSNNKGNKKKASMSPTDAPKGSLRYKCIRLLTWTESHTKRIMAELLWTLCHANAEEYTHRVGLGNAIPLLQARGLMATPLPTGS